MSGLSAETAAAQAYAASGAELLVNRYRSPAGEVDLVLRDGETIVFAEVKSRRSHAAAAEAITPRKIARIAASAECWLAEQDCSMDTPMRIDAALVDHMGRIEILRNVGM